MSRSKGLGETLPEIKRETWGAYSRNCIHFWVRLGETWDPGHEDGIVQKKTDPLLCKNGAGRGVEFVRGNKETRRDTKSATGVEFGWIERHRVGGKQINALCGEHLTHKAERKGTVTFILTEARPGRESRYRFKNSLETCGVLKRG